MYRSLPPNPAGRDFFLGDLHGHYARLERELAAVVFDATRDRLISVGDLVDRGPDSSVCLELVNEPWFFAVRGNHEQMMLDFLARSGADQARFGEFWSAYNGGGWFCEMAASAPPRAHRLGQLAACLPLAIAVETRAGRIGVVHAGVPAGVDAWEDIVALCTDRQGTPEDAVEEMRLALVWNRDRLHGQLAIPVNGIDAVVSGHTPVPDPLVLANSVFIDTGVAYDAGRLTLLSANAVAELVGPESISHRVDR